MPESAVSPPEIPRTPPLRASTGVPGLDEVLGGGLPPNRLYLIKGDPGVGKTTLAVQFLLEGARMGETGLYITLSETKEELEIVAESHGWNLEGLELFELSSMQAVLEEDGNHTFFHPSEVELNRATEALMAVINRVNPRRVVFDSLSEMRLLAETSLRYRRQILQFKQYFSQRRTTVLFLDDRSAGRDDLQIESIAHGVISLRCSSPEYGASRRQLTVNKLRGTGFAEGYHDLQLQKGGMTVFPRLTAAQRFTPFERTRFASGLKELDALLGGGLDWGTSNILLGPPGTGKSTLSMKFVLQAALEGRKSLVFIFDETIGTMLNRSVQLGMDLRPHVESGLVTLRQIDPAEVSPGEFAHWIARQVDKEGVRMVVIDSLNGYLNAMPADRYMYLQLHELLAYLNQQGVLTLMILTQTGIIGTMHSKVDLSYLADTVVLLRYFEAQGAVKQAISVIKKRSGNHERTIREMTLGPNGVVIGLPLVHMQGVLTGIPTITRTLPPEVKASSHPV
ncbi:MAG: circadian clock protein KaiC [Verrucomicrobiaceae bacterium]|nr:MAG: circadian clock protein KaiC [Verrucomicrobiaceae bacterium]